MNPHRSLDRSDATLHVRIDHLRVTAASAIEARRFAEQLPPALEAALRAWPDTLPSADVRHGRIETRHAASAAAQIVQAAMELLAADESTT